MANPLAKLRPQEFDYWAAQHLLNRAGFGGTPSQIRALANLGLDAAVDYLLDYESIDDERIRPDDFDSDIRRPPTADEQMMIRQARQSGDEALLARLRQRRQSTQRADRRQIRELQQWWLNRLVESPRPLQEKLTLFWHGHFASGYRKTENSYHMFLQNQLFRRHGAGNFRTLCKLIIRDPAMIAYLDNNRNFRNSPNENLARELMELFTLGEGNDYTERDIKEGARALTGYTFYDDAFIDKNSQEYRRMHDDGVKVILGKRGNWDGDDFVDIILSRPACSQFICHKLYRFFVNDLPGDPSREGQAFILALARQLRDRNDYDIRPVLKSLFQSAYFYQQENRASLIKSPVQLVTQAVRSMQLPKRSLPGLLNAMDLMGQQLFYPPSVKGWPCGRAWINTSTLYVRQNTLTYLLTGKRPRDYTWQPDVRDAEVEHLIDHLREHHRGELPLETAVVYLLRFTLGFTPEQSRIDHLLNFVRTSGGRLDNATLVQVLLLITAMPEYQLC